jgi:hypothetical protein
MVYLKFTKFFLENTIGIMQENARDFMLQSQTLTVWVGLMGVNT